MKKKFIYFLLICLLFLVFLIMMPVRADSGWDTDYDSDSSWDSGSSWDSDSSWDTGSSSYYHSSSPASGGVTVIITIVVIVIIVTVIAQENKKKTSSNIKISNVVNYNDITEEKLQSFDNNLTLEKFKEEVFNIYKDIQEAWMNFETDKIRNLTTDELYNMYKSQLETLKLKNQKNLILEIENVQVKIFDISKADGVITIKAFLRVSMYDYLINNKTKDVVRGSDQNKLLVDYELTFVKAENDNKEEEICPNCGAPVKIKASATCEYCGSTLTKKASKYVLSKKECIGQRKL